MATQYCVKIAGREQYSDNFVSPEEAESYANAETFPGDDDVYVCYALDGDEINDNSEVVWLYFEGRKYVEA